MTLAGNNEFKSWYAFYNERLIIGQQVVAQLQNELVQQVVAQLYRLIWQQPVAKSIFIFF